MADHERLYDLARYYDIAFSFRDVPREMDFLLGLRPGADSFLEVAAGPALHAREAARRGLRSVALDLSPGMRRYALEEARRERRVLDYRVADMTDFRLEPPCAVAALLMDSASYLLDNGAVLRHLACVADALEAQGIYVVEMAHPRDVYGTGRSAKTSWTSTRDGVAVDFAWGRADDPFHPATGIREVTVRMRYADGPRQGEVVDTAPQRGFTANEWRALVQASGRFRTHAEFGSLDAAVPFDDRPEAWRFVSVLQRSA